MRQRGFSAIQSGPFASHSASFVLKIFQLFHFHTGVPILITSDGYYWKRGIHATVKIFWEEDQIIFNVVGAIVTAAARSSAVSAAVLARANVAWNARSMPSNR